MSYSVHLFRREVERLHRESKSENFFEDDSNLLHFTPGQKESLKQRLEAYDYAPSSDDGSQVVFHHIDGHANEAVLTNSGLYFSTGLSEDDIFEVSMTASEFTDTGEFAKYDPQTGDWAQE